MNDGIDLLTERHLINSVRQLLKRSRETRREIVASERLLPAPLFLSIHSAL